MKPRAQTLKDGIRPSVEIDFMMATNTTRLAAQANQIQKSQVIDPFRTGHFWKDFIETFIEMAT